MNWLLGGLRWKASGAPGKGGETDMGRAVGEAPWGPKNRRGRRERSAAFSMEPGGQPGGERGTRAVRPPALRRRRGACGCPAASSRSRAARGGCHDGRGGVRGQEGLDTDDEPKRESSGGGWGWARADVEREGWSGGGVGERDGGREAAAWA